YYDIDVPRQAEITEKTVQKRTGGGKAGMGGFALEGSKGADAGFQSTYTLAPKQKATYSKVIDALVNEAGAVKVGPDSETPLPGRPGPDRGHNADHRSQSGREDFLYPSTADEFSNRVAVLDRPGGIFRVSAPRCPGA
ncbi:hypothetical protein ACFQ7B_42120, partial [Streptomyces erythrochromogenes]|uniref:hypothetical protein n=1 Tax=Streptomyces erythrochromogenes TaxID=285574 RepID=UPI0036817A65